ncbi:uncharacterized protein LOC144453519 [Glandiceps talaboti]
MEIENVSLKIEAVPPPAATLINSLSCCNKENLAILCDFNQVIVLNTEIKKEPPVFHISKTITIPRGESIECTCWSPDGRILAVAGRKLHLFSVVDGFQEVAVCDLYYVCKDISMCCKKDDRLDKYLIALAGPNGVEIHTCTMDREHHYLMSDDTISLHVELPIAMLKYSCDGQYLGVAAMDGHFGIWKVQDQMEEHKDFWFLHLRTLRITSIDFSEDAKKVAVSCWDGSYYVFQLNQEVGKFQWKTVRYNLNSPVEKVTGVLPGTLVCWSHQDRYFSLCNPTDKGSVVYVYCVVSARVQQITVCSGNDYVKGLTVKKIDGKEYIVYFTKKRKLGLVKITPGMERMPSQQEHWETLMESVSGTVSYNNSVTSPILRIEYNNLFKQCVDNFETDNTNCSTSTDNTCSDDIVKLNIVLPKKIADVSQRIVQRKSDKERNSLPKYEVLLSSNAVVFLSGLAAHVYLFVSKQWKSIVFRKKTLKVILCSGDWLVYITTDRTLCMYNLTNDSLKKYQSPITVNNLLDDITMVASTTRLYCVLLDIDRQGNGHTLQIEFSESIQVKRQSVCLPFMRENSDYGRTEVVLIGGLLVFHQWNSQSSTASHQYHVVIPGLSLHRSFQLNEQMEFTKFCDFYSEQLCHLQNLVKTY